MEFKFKEKHYKKARFTEKEKLISDFKKNNITKDLHEVKEITDEFIGANFQILKKGDRVKIPQHNHITKVKTQSQINIFSIFLNFIEQYDSIDFLSIETYTFNEKTVYSLNELLNQGKIKQLQIIMTETANFRLPKIYGLLKELFSENKNVNLVFYWVHSKVNLVQCGNNKFIIDGSGNFSMNAQVEHYNIINSNEMYDSELEWANDFYFSKKLRKSHEIFKNY